MTTDLDDWAEPETFQRRDRRFGGRGPRTGRRSVDAAVLLAQDTPPVLSEREREILRLLAARKTTKEVGIHFGITQGRVCQIVQRIKEKVSKK